jgi:hypothetical protein
MKTILFIGILIGLLVCAAVMGSGEEKIKKKSCKEHPILSGPCYKVKGKMFFANGTPSVRIWPIGTKRILGVSEQTFYNDAYANIPDDLVNKLSWQTVIYADFTVCPFTDDKPGVMRLTCVDSAKNLSIRNRK